MTRLIVVGLSIVGLFAFVVPAAPRATATAAAAETCFYKSEKTSGMNKICYYDCGSGPAAITIKSVELCPLNIKR